METERSRRLLSLRKRKGSEDQSLPAQTDAIIKSETVPEINVQLQNEDFKKPKSPEPLSRCSVCQKNLSHMNCERRNQHHNKCLDKQEQMKTMEPTVKPTETQQLNLTACPLCKKCIQNNCKASHLKVCGPKNNLSTEKTLECLKVWQRHDDEYTTLGLVAPVSDSTNRSRLPKKKPQKNLEPKSKLEYDLQMAKAMSASHQEKINREKEMELDLLDGKHKFELTYSNKITERKNKSRIKMISDPILLFRTEEERKRILSEKVAGLLASPVENFVPEDSFYLNKIIGNDETAEPKCRRNILQFDDEILGIKKEKLWCLTGYSEQEGKEAFYVSLLEKFISPAITNLGKNLKDYAEIPGRECTQRSKAEMSSEEEEEGLKTDHSEEEISSTQCALLELGIDSSISISTEDSETNLQDIKETSLEDVINQSISKPSCLVGNSAAERPVNSFNQNLELGNNSRKLQSDLSLMVGNPLLKDIEIKTEDGSSIPAHCFMIYARCPEMYKEINSSSCIDLSPFSKNAVLAFLHFLYSAEVIAVEETIAEVIALSERYEVKDLFKALTSEKPGTSTNFCDIEEVSLNSPEDCTQTEKSEADKSDSPIFMSSFHQLSSSNDYSPVADLSCDNNMEVLSPPTVSVDNTYFQKFSASDHSHQSSQQQVSGESRYSDKKENFSITKWSNDHSIDSCNNILESNCFDISMKDDNVLDKTGSNNKITSDDILQKSVYSEVHSNSELDTVSFSNLVNSDNILGKSDFNNLTNPCYKTEKSNSPKKITSDNIIKENGSCCDRNSDIAESDCKSQSVVSEFENQSCEYIDLLSNKSSDEDSNAVVPNSKSNLNSLQNDYTSKFFMSGRIILESNTVISEGELHSNSPDLFNEEAKKAVQKSDSIDLEVEKINLDSDSLLSRLKETEGCCNHEASTSTPKSSDLYRTKVHTAGYRFSVSPIEQSSDKVPFRRNQIISDRNLSSPEADKRKNSDTDCYSSVFHSNSYHNRIAALQNPSEIISDTSITEEIASKKFGSFIQEVNESNLEPFKLNPYVEETMTKEQFERRDSNRRSSDFKEDEQNKKDNIIETVAIEISDNDSFLQNDKFEDIKNTKNGSELQISDRSNNEFISDNDLPDIDVSFNCIVDDHSQKEVKDNEEDYENPKFVNCFVTEEPGGSQKPTVDVLSEGPDSDIEIAVETDNIEEEKLQQTQVTRKTRGQSQQGNAQKKASQCTSKKTKQLPITPMPNYESVTTPEVKKELKKYGIRGLPKKKGIEYLKYIYEETHPLVTDDDASFQCKHAADKQNDDSNKILQQKSRYFQENDSTSSNTEDDSSEDEILEESLFNNRNHNTMSSSQKINDQETKTLIRDFINSRNDLMQKILTYEPFHVEDLSAEFKAAGLNIKIEKIIEFLDEECITFSMAKDAWQKRRKRKCRKRSPTKRSPKKKRNV